MITNVNRCFEWRALASSRLDGELDELRTARLERHLVNCGACRAWTEEVAALATLLRDAEPAQPARSLELHAQTLRRRLVRASAVGATAASAAAAAVVAAVALGSLGHGVTLFSSANTPAASPTPCTSCTKKQAVTSAFTPPPLAGGPIHVANPFVNAAVGDDTP